MRGQGWKVERALRRVVGWRIGGLLVVGRVGGGEFRQQAAPPG